MRLYRANFSTNVERVALALAHKGIAVESRYIDKADRSEVERVSGQGLVPVLVDGDTIVTDSLRIMVYIEDLLPTAPPLFPRDDARYAEMMIFLEWFDRVWKIAPNRIAAELESEQPDHMVIIGQGRQMQGALEGFEALLAGRKFLMGSELSAADCAVFPFVKYALKRDDVDAEPFHLLLEEYQQLDESEHMRLRSWIKRMDDLPRA
ncbi:MAG: glutathione S-transferase family protein [Solirubrobacteraceae bacterium]